MVGAEESNDEEGEEMRIDPFFEMTMARIVAASLRDTDSDGSIQASGPPAPPPANGSARLVQAADARTAVTAAHRWEQYHKVAVRWESLNRILSVALRLHRWACPP